MDREDYYAECITISLNDMRIPNALTAEQIAGLAADIASARENEGLAFYSPPAGEHLMAENARLQRELNAESAKVVCKECGGRGRIVSYGGTFMSDSPCHKCNGEGKV